MWPNKPFDYIKLEADEKGRHYGLFVNKELVSVISLFIDEKDMDAQFRKFATLASYQGKGYGTALIKHLFSELAPLNVERIWCNARIHKAEFYERFGMTQTEETFFKGEIEYVVMKKSVMPS